MIKVNCEACGAPYDVDPRRIPASGLKMRCPACGTTFHVHPSGATGAGAAQKQAAQDALDLDLPAPKLAAGVMGRAPNPRPAQASAQQKGPDLRDLSAAKDRRGGSLPEDLADDLEDPSGPGATLGASTGFDLDLPAAKGFDLDLPAPKTSAGLGATLRRPAQPTPAQTKPVEPAPAKPAEPALPVSAARARQDALDLELPAAKPVGPAGFSPSKPGAFKPLTPASVGKPSETNFGDLDLDLPARKKPGGQQPAAATARAGKGALAPDFELDLPAAKGAPALAGPAPDFELDLPAPKGAAARGAFTPDVSVEPPAAKDAAAPAPLAPDFELDLPAPKGAGPRAPAGGFDLDLPTPKGAVAPAARATPASLDVDLPAAKGASKGGAPQPGGFGDFDLDLPSFKPEIKPTPHESQAKVSAPSRSFSKPSAAGFEVKPAQRLGSLPKDSLAMDPSPMFAGQRANGALGDLDDVQIAFGDAQAAPNNLPAVKRGGPAATMLGLGKGGLGSAGKMTKDSLDMPRGFDGSSDLVVFEDRDLLPAPADLPKVKAQGAVQAKTAPAAEPSGLDLPAPADLPVKKKAPPGGATMLGLGSAARQSLNFGKEPAAPAKPASTALGIGEMLSDSLGSGNDSGSASSLGAFDFELDLPPPTRPAQDASGPIELEKLSLPSGDAARGAGKAPFGATMALGADDIELGEHPDRGLSIPGLADDDPFRGMGHNRSNSQTIELDSVLEFGAAPRTANDGRSNSAFGELDFGPHNGPKTGGLPLVQPRPMPMPVPAPSPQGFDTRAVEAELLGEADVSAAPVRKRKKKARRDGSAIPGYVWPILVVLVIGAAGVGLGTFTSHGYFGVYLLEQLLPAAGDPAQVAAAISQAEKVARTDSYVDIRKSLAVLSDARNEAGLNRQLLARSLLNEALYQLRFGDDAQSAQRSVAILARVMERGDDAEGLTLARAADAARRGVLDEASALLAQVPPGKDPYRALVAGEVALRQKKPAEAFKAFQEALGLGGAARASWGAARAAIALDQLADAEASARQTLSESPAHSAALTFMARRAFAQGDAKLALEYTQKATGAVRVGEQRAHPSRKDRAEAWGLSGQIERLLDHPREAQAAYEASLAADPLRVDSLIGSGTMLMRLGRARDALSRFDSALSARPSATPDALGHTPLIEASVGAVQALLVLERASEALPRATALSAQYPDDPQVSLWLGHSLEAVEKWDEAKTAFSQAIAQAPNSFSGYVALSQLFFKNSRPEEGARVLSEATSKVRDSAEVRRMLGYSELTRNHLPEAIHHFQAALHFDANDAGSLLGLTTAQRKSGDIGAAEKTLDRLQKVDPTLAGLRLERGQLLESRGDYSAAADVYRKALEARPHDTDLKLRLGAALVTAGRLDDAEAILPDVLKERPTSAEAEHFVGRLLFAKKETAQAVQHFERSIAFDALRAEYHQYLAWAYLEQGNLGAALATINKALERDPNLGDARWILGRIQLRTGAVKDALGSFQQTLKLKPGRVEALANMGDAYDQLRDVTGAIRSYQEAVKQMPENGEWWYRLGMLHLDKGSRDEARVTLAEAVLRGDRLIEKPSWLADAHRHYGDVLREGGRGGEALENYRVFLEIASASHPDRAEIERIVRSGQR